MRIRATVSSVVQSMTVLVPIFADQLSRRLSSLMNAKKEVTLVLMMEVEDEASNVWHHRRKLVFLFSAMRHFAQELREAGWAVEYVRLNDKANTVSFSGEIKRLAGMHDVERVQVTEPGDWRVDQAMRGIGEELGIPVRIMTDDRFLTTKAEFREWAQGRKQLRMEYFYREKRRQTGLLMDGDNPQGGEWNYDSENRKPAKGDLFMPQPLGFEPDAVTSDVIEMVLERFPDRFGEVSDFRMAVTSTDAGKAAGHFMSCALESFGDYQDAMLEGEAFLYHSILAPYMNAGLLDPLELCRMAETAYREKRAPLNAVEGFIRQIIGWREYVRGIYWLKMPDYLDGNFLDARRPLPEFYWTGATRMNCVSQVVGQTRKHAYSHHIQRLMITGNFALLAGIRPQEVHEWYLAVYADAFDWVEVPNTIGMALFADGGVMASKPYAASASYINRMSDFCGACHYDHGARTSDTACPFNALYWDFLARNREKLENNPRMKMMYRNLDRMDDLDAIRSRAVYVLDGMSRGVI